MIFDFPQPDIPFYLKAMRDSGHMQVRQEGRQRGLISVNENKSDAKRLRNCVALALSFCRYWKNHPLDFMQ